VGARCIFFVDATLKQMASNKTPVTCTAKDVGDTVHVRCTQAVQYLGLMQTVAECTARVFQKKYYHQKWNPAVVTWWKLRSGGGVVRPFDADDVQVTQEAVATLLDALRKKNVGAVYYDARPGEVDLMRRADFYEGVVHIDDRREEAELFYP
jgi:hypothetical protein